MQMQPIYLAVLLLAIVPGCKNRGKAVEGASAQAREEAATVVEPAVEEAAEEPAQQDLPADSVYFSIERTPCYGTCPAYRLTIFQDGSATYEGRRFAEREGLFTGKVDASTMLALKEAAESKGFYDMDDVYDSPITDLPSTIIRLQADGRDKKVVGRVGAPMAFKNLALLIEEMLSTVAWTKVGRLE